MASGDMRTVRNGDRSQRETPDTSGGEQLQDDTAAFGNFLVDLESLITCEKAQKLATAFEFKPAELDNIERSSYPGHVFVQLLRDKGIIDSSDISALIKQLKACNLHGVANDINQSLQKYNLGRKVKTLWPQQLEAKRVFLVELRRKYSNLFNAVQPIPYVRDRLFCVDRVFVEGGIEYFIVNSETGIVKSWSKLNSYKDIFKAPRVKSDRRIIEGDPGFGKSTLTLQMAYDWCNGTSEYEILILLRLKQLGGVKSIYKAIKQFILPKDSRLLEKDIQGILEQSNSALVILDSFDEYPDRGSDESSDVISIIKRDMFQSFDVILTTRTACLPKDPVPQTQRIRLTGFDENAQDEYIRKAVVGNDEEAAINIKQRLIENHVLADLCQVPLFFVMYAHMSHERKDQEKFKSVTSFFRYMIWCFHHHLKNKLKEENVQQHFQFEADHHELDKLAFEGLCGENQQLIWGKEELRKRVGRDFYNHYVRLGILIEEDFLDVEATAGAMGGYDLVQEKTEVRFYHKLFCEWYAAHFLSTLAARENVRFMGNDYPFVQFVHKIFGRKDISDILQQLDPFDLQYVFRFACGQNPDAASKIIEHLKNKQGAQNFAILCILEKEGKIETILNSVEGLCSGRVAIDHGHSHLLQRSTIQLLDIASTNGIPISGVYLHGCYSTMGLSGENNLQLKSNLSVPVLTTLNKLTIDERRREITEEEFKDILQYSSKCLALKELVFTNTSSQLDSFLGYYLLLPQTVNVESVSVLKARRVLVRWRPLYGDWYRLNLESGLWEKESNGSVMADGEYQYLVRATERESIRALFS